MDKTQIEYVANLSRLKLTETEKELFVNQLLSVFGHINKLNEIDTKDVTPMANAIDLKNVFRNDVNTPSIAQQQALENSPSKTQDFFKVPQVLD
ncbi:MAG: Asp-tRNA(Asn)/Glu-tRNA(Gln) amidotransferase subunit GatC [Candidatus Anammoxibacter sp.]